LQLARPPSISSSLPGLPLASSEVAHMHPPRGPAEPIQPERLRCPSRPSGSPSGPRPTLRDAYQHQQTRSEPSIASKTDRAITAGSSRRGIKPRRPVWGSTAPRRSPRPRSCTHRHSPTRWLKLTLLADLQRQHSSVSLSQSRGERGRFLRQGEAWDPDCPIARIRAGPIEALGVLQAPIGGR
jgi:hypothetical protein